MCDEEDRKGTAVMGLKAVLAVALALSMPLVLPGAVAAQEAGSFRSLQSYVQDFTTIEHAGGAYTAGTLIGTSTVLESSGPPFVKGATNIARCLVFVGTFRDGVVDLESPCTFTDGTGDEIYLLARRREGDIAEGGGGAGRFEIMGGTGKFAGISGGCTYVARYLPANHADSASKCTWQRP
ncbi:MAG: hypothetical protein OXI66_19105 [Boseongicola sp.]|nr:hypothetical protein [Boseongicola sp.]